MTTETNRMRLFLYTSTEDFDEGDATKSVLITGELDLGRELMSFFNKYPTEDAYVVEVNRNPGF